MKRRQFLTRLASSALIGAGAFVTASIGFPCRVEADSTELKKVRALLDWMQKLDEGYEEDGMVLVGVFVDDEGNPAGKWKKKPVKKPKVEPDGDMGVIVKRLVLPKPRSIWVYYGGDSGDSLRRHNTNIHGVPYYLQRSLNNRELRIVHSLCHNGRSSAAINALKEAFAFTRVMDFTFVA